MFSRIIAGNTIKIGEKIISFSKETIIQKLIELDNLVCFSIQPVSNDLNWKNIETHQIWKKRCDENPSQLFCYNNEGNQLWKFDSNEVVGFEAELPMLKKPEDFITSEHYKKYMKKFVGRELLIVYTGNFRYRVDANTGEIHDKIESR